MTQTPPKPSFKQPQITIRTASPSQPSMPKAIAAVEPQTEPKKANFWQNLSFKWKLALLLVAGAALPVIGVTQGIVWYSQQNAQKTLEETVKSNATGFEGDYVHWLRLESTAQANTIANVLKTAKIDLQNPEQIKANQALLKSLVEPPLLEVERPDGYKSFRTIADVKGRTITQYIKVQKDYPLGTTSEQAAEFVQPISMPTGIDLSSLPIVQNALRLQRPLKGIELVDGRVIKALGMGEQIAIPDNPQETGLVAMAVEPIKINSKVVGLAVTGTLLNKNHILVDTFLEYYGSEASIFARDLQVSTTTPTEDGKNRAIGTRAPKEVVETVLNQGKPWSGRENFSGTPYLAAYLPLYDHTQELNPKAAKPVGMLFVGSNPQTLEKAVGSIQAIGYGIGGGFLLLSGLIAVLGASTISRSLQQLQDIARKIARGEKVAGLAETDRQDEIGVLSKELNQMAVQIESSLQTLRQETAREQLLKDVTLELSQYPQNPNAFNKALEKLRLYLKADRAMFHRFDEETFAGSVIAESVASGFPPALGALITDPCFNDKMAEEYRQGRIQVLANIYESDLNDCHIQMLEPFAIKAHLVVPVLRGSKGFLAGLLVVNQCSGSRVWQENEINLLTQVATQVGLTIDRVNLIEQTRASANRAQALKDITLKMSQAFDPTKIFTTAVEEIRKTIESDRVVVYKFDASWKGTVIAESVIDGFPKALGAEIADPCFADRYVDKYKQGRVQATPDIYSAGLTDCHLKQLEPFEVKANLVAPILVSGELLGLLIAHQCSRTRNWQKTETDFFAQIATQVGLALERANLIEQQRSEKENLQRRALELLQQVDPVSRGDLTIRAAVTEDEIGTVADSYNSTVESLRKIVGQVKIAVQQMTVTTSHNQGSVQTLSQEAVRQAEEISNALNRIQIMTQSIREVTANAKQAEMAAQQASQTVLAGDKAMNRTVDGILAIRETVSETAEKVKRLGESTQKISKVVNLIGRFAAQTHMLALKASIEAARAGDEGQGFAVIADEVRMLAAQSAEATAEIGTLVTSIQTETNEVANAMETGTTRVMTGTKLVEETRQSLTKIAEVNTQINQLVKAIARAASEQSQASEVVSHTMTEVASISTKTSTEATQVSDSFQELLMVAQTLQKSVGQFKVE